MASTCSSCCKHNHAHDKRTSYIPEILSLTMLLAGMAMKHIGISDIHPLFSPLYYLISVIPVGYHILRATLALWAKADFANEFTLMLLACAGAFCIGEYPEAVAVLLFYSFGEKIETSASGKARGRIMAMIDRLPKLVIAETGNGTTTEMRPEEVTVGTVIIVKPGERVALDGTLDSPEETALDTSAITGESVPAVLKRGDTVTSGSIPLDREIRLTVTHPYNESTMSRIMSMIEEAAAGKSTTETMLRRITRWYTPTVIALAAALFLIPALPGALCGDFTYEWRIWMERSLILLVCSCPCALVVSIPLSYFSALGRASGFGVLFKGSRHLDTLRNIDTLLLDKTGTLTTGQFRVTSVTTTTGYSEDDIIRWADSLDSHSNHPLAAAISAEAADRGIDPIKADNVVNIAHGLIGNAAGRDLAVGSRIMMNNCGITVPRPLDNNGESEVCIALDGQFIGSIRLADTLKDGATEAVRSLRKMGINDIRVISGDREDAVNAVATEVGANGFRAGLFPADKHDIVTGLQAQGHKVAFIGDGINDAPSLAAADLGVAINSGGSDIAMESADAVITGTDLRRFADTLRLSRKLKHIVTINIMLAIGVKALVMALGATGLATMWAAVFADTGITLITIALTLVAFGLMKPTRNNNITE